MRTKTRFEEEAEGNSEMAYLLRAFFDFHTKMAKTGKLISCNTNPKWPVIVAFSLTF